MRKSTIIFVGVVMVCLSVANFLVPLLGIWPKQAFGVNKTPIQHVVAHAALGFGYSEQEATFVAGLVLLGFVLASFVCVHIGLAMKGRYHDPG